MAYDRIGYSINNDVTLGGGVLCWRWKSMIESVYNYLCGENYIYEVNLFAIIACAIRLSSWGGGELWMREAVILWFFFFIKILD